MSNTGNARKRTVMAAAAAAGLCLVGAKSALATSTLIESWENTTDGWTVTNSNFTSLGFSTTKGVTNGSYSWEIGPSATNTGTGPGYGQFILSPSTTAITADLATATQISIDIYNPGGSFGYYQQWDLEINNGDTGFVSLDGYAYPAATIGGEKTLTWTIPTSVSTVLATSTKPTSLVFQVGGGYSAGNETVYIDNVEVTNSAAVTFSQANASWVTNGSSAWEGATNWSSNPTIPGAAGSQITFDNNGGAITANPTVTLSNPAAATLLTFGNTNGGSTPNYTIASGAPQAAIAVSGEIDADSGTHVINVPVSTSGGNFYFGTQSGASLTIPHFTDTSYGSITETGGGTISLGGLTLHANVTASGTLTFQDGTCGGFIYGLNAPTGSTINLGKNTWNTNSIAGDGNGGGVINIPSGGILYTAEYISSGGPAATAYSGTLSGAGSLVIGEGATSTDTSTTIYGNTETLYGNNSAFTGTITAGSSYPPGTTYMTAPAQFTLQVGAANNLGSGTSTNQVILDGGILQITNSFVATQGVQITANNGTIDTNTYNLTVGAVSGAGTLNKISAGTLTLGSASTYSGNTNVVAGTLALAVPGSLPAGTNLTIASGANVLALAHGSTAGSKIVLTVSSLNLAGSSGAWSSQLDLANNDMIIHNGSATTVNNEIGQSFNNGLWNGTGGITSSSAEAAVVAGSDVTALGYELNSTGSGVLVSSFDGVAVTSTDVLVKYTYFGDADLSGTVNGSDYTLIDTGFNNRYSGWHNGDFNYDGVVNGNDYTLIDNAYNNQTLGALSEDSAPANLIASDTAQVAPVPEPASFALAGLAVAGLGLRRRRVEVKSR